MRYIILLLALVSFSFAQPLSLGTPNEEKVHSSWLNVGLGIGYLSDEFVNPSFLIGIQFAELSAITFEVDCTAPHGGFGGWFGFEQQFMTTQITPFAEAQIGARSNAFSPAASINTGIIFFRENPFRVRLKGGYEQIFNKDKDKSWNMEVGILFAIGQPGLETIKVK